MSVLIKKYSAGGITPVTRKSIVKEFTNFYSKSRESIEIYYRLWHGWHTLEEARGAVSALGLNEEVFVYISLDGEWNAVSMQALSKQVVINKDIISYRNNGEEVFAPAEEVINGKALDSLGITRPCTHTIWCKTIKEDIESLFDVQIVPGYKARPTARDKGVLGHNALILLATTMFDTMVPVFKLNVMDSYLEYSPSRQKLWAKGISKYNYYTGEAEYVSEEEIARLRALEEAKKV